ncbi:cobalamin-binding protein [Pseudomonas sp. MBLB4123]|uniref:cobalamin-binding protein n=1 Tax=Pseudomonas sp. MBLB4123 TaxID=3451557 RepID=UPI003F75583C
MPRLALFLLGLLAWPALAVERVVSLAPSLSEIVVELDAVDLLVGVLDGGERPAALRHLPSVGRYGQLEMESLIGLQPDLVLLWPDSISPAQRRQLRDFGIPLLIAEPRDLDNLAEQFAEIGERLGRAEQGRQLRRRFGERLTELHAHYRRERPLRVFYQIWDKPLYTIGGRQIISDALRLCGAENVFADLALPAPQVSVEAVLQRDPEVILAGSGAQLDIWRSWPGLAAVRRNQLYPVPDKGLERPSFQMLAATEKLCALLAEAR